MVRWEPRWGIASGWARTLHKLVFHRKFHIWVCCLANSFLEPQHSICTHGFNYKNLQERGWWLFRILLEMSVLITKSHERKIPSRFSWAGSQWVSVMILFSFIFFTQSLFDWTPYWQLQMADQHTPTIVSSLVLFCYRFFCCILSCSCRVLALAHAGGSGVPAATRKSLSWRFYCCFCCLFNTHEAGDSAGEWKFSVIIVSSISSVSFFFSIMCVLHLFLYILLSHSPCISCSFLLIFSVCSVWFWFWRFLPRYPQAQSVFPWLCPVYE